MIFKKNKSFVNDWKLSCEKIRNSTKSNKVEPLLFSVKSYQTGDEPDSRVIDIFGFSLDEKTALKNSIIKNGGKILSELVSMQVFILAKLKYHLMEETLLFPILLV